MCRLVSFLVRRRRLSEVDQPWLLHKRQARVYLRHAASFLKTGAGIYRLSDSIRSAINDALQGWLLQMGCERQRDIDLVSALYENIALFPDEMAVRIVKLYRANAALGRELTGDAWPQCEVFPRVFEALPNGIEAWNDQAAQCIAEACDLLRCMDAEMIRRFRAGECRMYD